MDVLSDVLAQLRLAGSLYFRTEFTSPWAVKVPRYNQVARFHFAHRGACFVRIEGCPEQVPLAQGDLIVIMNGASHTLYCDPDNENQALMLDDVVERSGFTGSGALVYGEPGTNQETQLVCGHFAFDHEARHPLIDALPPYIHVPDYGESSGRWMENTLRVIGNEAGRDNPGSTLIALKLSEIIFVQTLRAYLEKSGDTHPGLAGFTDPKLSQAIKAMHASPHYPWVLEELATRAGMSRTSFANRFASRLGTTPIGYLTAWRMLLARRKLTETHEPIIEIAQSVGYQSEAAFSRVFKKTFAIAPATFRRSFNNAG